MSKYDWLLEFSALQILLKMKRLIFNIYKLQAVADFLAQICNYVGPNLESICLEFVSEYTDDIIDQLVHNYLQPQQVCDSIGACP